MSIFEDFYYLIFPKIEDQGQQSKDDAFDKTLWVKVVIIAFVVVMAIIFAITTN